MQRRQRNAVIERDERLALFVRDRLAEGWSPQQISGWLRSGVEAGSLARVSYMTSTRAKAPLRWPRLLWETGLFYIGIDKNRASIHERPENVNNRSQIGNWEADLIICQRTRPVLVLHERKSRVTLAAKLTGKSAAETAGAIMAIFKRLDPVLRQSITFDNGTEFARHSLLKETLGMATWFCDAYASWQKGGIENANGRLRRWLTRKTNLDDVSDEDIQDIVMTYNLTPRKCLGYITPIQALFQNLGRDVRLTFA